MAGKVFKLHLLGHIQLYSPCGEEIAVEGLGEKSKALLAILAMRPEQPIARTYIQDKLWSDRGEVQGRNSLKQSLRQVRNLFRNHGHDLIMTNGGPIRLDRTHLWIDVHDADKRNALSRGDFLEGIDVRDAQFNIWLSSVRAQLSEPTQVPVMANHVNELAVGVQRHALGIMPLVVHELDSKARVLGDLMIDRILNAVSYYELYDVHDFRQATSTEGRGVGFALSAQALTVGADLNLSITLRRLSDNRRLMGHQVPIDVGSLSADLMSQLAIQISDRIVHSIEANCHPSHYDAETASKLVVEGIDRLFRPSRPTVEEAVSAFGSACEIEPKSSYLAWHAYSSAHVLEIEKRANRQDILEQTEFLAARALEIDPYNPLTRILLTHVYAFVFRDFDRADSLITPLQNHPPDNPLYYYVLGCLRSYQSAANEAEQAAAKARYLGRHSPYSHIFLSLAAMTSSMAGKFDDAILRGNEALSRQPNDMPAFGPTLRYLAAAYEETGQFDEADTLLADIRAQDPEFNAARLLDPSFPVPSATARHFLNKAFTQIEARQRV